jgi:hypothetical protein
VDPPTGVEQGYRESWKFSPKYSEELRAKFPLKLEGTKSVVSTIGMEVPAVGGAYEGLEVAAVLTVVDKAPAKDAFRPPYVKGEKPMYAKSQLRWERLPKLKAPAGVALPDFKELMRRVRLEHAAGKGNMNSSIHPRKNMTPYQGYAAREVSTVAMLVLTDIPAREELTVRLVQYGIDLSAIVHDVKDAWRGYGGFGEGRKWPILFAGLMLGEDKMLKLPKTVESNNTINGTTEKFGEDGHTYYGKATADYPKGKPLWGNEVPGNIFAEKKAKGAAASGAKDARDPDGIEDGMEYRTICSVPCVGPALAARLMGAQEIWDHPAFFDYMDRWVKEGGVASENAKRKPLEKAIYCYGGEFHKAMWEAYRPKAEAIAKQFSGK